MFLAQEGDVHRGVVHLIAVAMVTSYPGGWPSGIGPGLDTADLARAERIQSQRARPSRLHRAGDGATGESTSRAKPEGCRPLLRADLDTLAARRACLGILPTEHRRSVLR